MKKLLPLILCLLAGQAAAYSLTSIESEPIPQQEFFQLIHPAALEQCESASTTFSLTPEQCRSSMNARQSLCAGQVGQGAAGMISSRALAELMQHDYQQCVAPGYSCNGVEVRTLEEAEKHCS